MEGLIQLNNSNLSNQHICCAISDKKCKDSYELKKQWLSKEFEKGYVFRRIDARAKVFIEYGPAEFGWAPIKAKNHLLINCFWVSGKYKKNGYGKRLLQKAIDDAIKQNKKGLVTIVGTKKFHFMSDTKWLLKQGFEEVDKTDSGFSLLQLKLNKTVIKPSFYNKCRSGEIANKNGLVVYFSNRCPFAEFHVMNSLQQTAKERNIPLKIIKLKTMEDAQRSATPATIFSLYYNGQFITTDISACMSSRFDKFITLD